MIRSIIIVLALMLTIASNGYSANYTLEITQPQPSLNTNNRYYKAYPGIPYEVPIGVFGGLFPFTYELTTAPSGMTINADTGIITWPNPTTVGSPHTVAIRVTDDENNTDTVSWTIDVTTSGFVFLDIDAANGGDGTIGSPLNSLGDIFGPLGGPEPTTYDNHFMYFRGGTYGIEGGYRSNCPGQQCHVSLNITRLPHVWMAYPGEDVTIDHNLATDSNGIFFALNNGSADFWMSGITFRDMLNHAVRTGGSGLRQVFYDNTFYNGGPGADGDNPSFLMFGGSSVSQTPSYILIKDNVFDTASDFAFIKTYSTNKMVFEGNTLQNPSGSNEGYAIKAYDRYMSVRGNTFDGDFTAGSISGNWNQVGYLDISFNNIKNANTDGDPWGAYTVGALGINHDGSALEAYIYRNTFEGGIQVRGQADAGPFYLYSNVIVNDMGAYDDPDGSLVHAFPEGGSTTDNVVFGTGGAANLVGGTGAGIIDAYGDLTSTYAAYLGTHGHQTTASVCSPTHRHLCDVSNCETTGEGYWDGTDCLAEEPGTPVNGTCGTNSGGTFPTLASGTSGNCATGTVSSFTAVSGGWEWGCAGSNGGTSVTNCAATQQAVGGGTGRAPYSATARAPYSATSFARYYEEVSP